MKKIVTMCLSMLLVCQFLVPSIVIAKSMVENSELAFTQVTMDASSKKEDVLMDLSINAETTQAKEVSISASSNFTITDSETAEIKNQQGTVQGSYRISNHIIYLSVLPNTIGELNFSIRGAVAENSREKKVSFSLGAEVKEVLLPDEWIQTPVSNSSTTESAVQESSTKVSETQSTTSESSQEKQQLFRANQDIRDIYQSLNKVDNFLTSMSLDFTDPNGNPVTDPTVDDTIQFSFTFALDEAVRQLMQGGDYFTLQLPNTVKIAQQQSYPLSDSDGVQYAEVVINLDGSVVLTFTNNVQNASDITGDFHFTGLFNKTTITGPGPIVIIPGSYDDLKVTLLIKPNYSGNAIDKKGYFDRLQNPDKITWDVDFNKGLNLLENAQVKEVFPVGTTFNSVQVYQISVDFNGQVIEGSETLVDSSKYTVGSNGTVTFNSPIQEAYRIEYTTTINEEAKPGTGGITSFTNHATLSSSNTQDVTAAATVDARYGKEVEKIKGNYDNTKQILNWKIAYNYGEKTITNGSITDTFQNSNMTLIPNSVQIFEVTFTDSGVATQGNMLVLGSDYELVPTSNGFKINFLKDVQTALDVMYQTGYNGIVDSTISLENDVKTSTNQTSTNTGTIMQQNVIKKLGAVDYTNQTVGWTIDINRNNYTMNQWVFTDTASQGLALKVETFKIFDNNTQQYLVPDQDYTFGYDPVSRITSVSFINDYLQTDHSFVISYTDDYDTGSDASPNIKFVNTAKTTWVTTDGQTITNENEQTFFPNDATRYNGLKSGSYNALTKLITWTIAIDYRDSDLVNGKITDPIQTGQNYVPGTIKIYSYSIGSNGEIIKGAEITAEQYLLLGIQEPSATNNQTLIIDIPNNVYGKYLAEFQTSLANELVQSKYTNNAVFSNDNYQDYTLNAEVSVNHGDEFLVKGGTQDSEGYVNWGVTINGSQSTLYDVTIKDLPSANQAIDLSSLHIYNTTVDAQGVLTKNLASQLIQGTDYTVDLETDNATGQQTLSVHLIGNYTQLERALVMDYRTMVFLETASGTVTNEVQIKSIGKTQIDTTTNTSTQVVVSDGGGSASGIKGKLVIKKVDEKGLVLPQGATFNLLDKNKNQVLRSGTVDQNGLLTFGSLIYGTYVLQETNTLTAQGYTIAPQLVDGINIDVNATTSQGTPIVIKNDLGQVILTKVSETSQKLEGAKFKLQMYNALTSLWSPYVTNQPLITAADGTLKINGLAPGRYRLVETAAPENYILNTEPVEFQVAVNESNQLVQIGMTEPYLNYQAAIRFIKTDSSGAPLPDSTFALYKAGNDTPVQSVSSDQNGQVLFTGVGPGIYTIKEVTSPNGYVLNTEKIEVNVPNQTDKPIETIAPKDYINYQGSIKVQKEDSTGLPISGGTFELRDKEGKAVEIINDSGMKTTQLTAINGIISATGIVPGNYYLVERQAPKGYIRESNQYALPLTINSEGLGEIGSTATGKFINYKGSILLKKIDKENKTLLADAKFDLYTKAGEKIKSNLVTNDQGQLKVEALSPGAYYFSEKEAPKGYELSKEKYEFTITEAASGKPEMQEVTATNILKPITTIEDSKKMDRKLSSLGEKSGNLFIIVGVAVLLSLVSYVIWRLRRNKNSEKNL